MADLFIAKAVCDLAGVSYRQLNYWTTELRAIHTEAIEGQKDHGSGNHRIYTHEEAAIAEAIGRLRDVPAVADLLRSAATEGAVDIGTLGVFRLVRSDQDES